MSRFATEALMENPSLGQEPDETRIIQIGSSAMENYFHETPDILHKLQKLEKSKNFETI